MQSAAESERKLARGFFADVEVLVKPTAGRAQNAALAPAQLDDLIAAACRVRLRAALLRPEQRVSFRFQNHDHRAGAVVVRFVVTAAGPIGDVADESIFR